MLKLRRRRIVAARDGVLDRAGDGARMAREGGVVVSCIPLFLPAMRRLSRASQRGQWP